MGLHTRPAALEAAVLGTQLGTKELQLPGYEHEERQLRLLHAAASAGLVAYCQFGGRYVVKLACRPEVCAPLHRVSNSAC